jgi:hypothetical protein
MGLKDDLLAFREKALQQASISTNKIVRDLDTQAVNLSPSPSNPGPFAKGLLVNQWYASVGSSPSSEVGTATSDTGVDSLSRLEATLASNPFYGKDNIVTFANNVDHAYYAEVLGWQPPLWSGHQGPYAMARGAVTYTIAKYSQ